MSKTSADDEEEVTSSQSQGISAESSNGLMLTGAIATCQGDFFG
jgi:hypothetical protein